MKKNLIPQIRFPEFKKEWKHKRLSELMTRVSKNNKDEEFSVEEILSLSSTKGIVDRKELLGDTYDKVNHKNYIKTRLNDLVYGKSISARYPYGLFKVNDCRDGLLSTLYFTFKVNDNVCPAYLDRYFSYRNRANNFLKKYVLVGDRYITADANYILSGKVFIPQLPEQQKIAHFFSTIDDKINQLQNKKNALQQYKKGVMQKIFAAGEKSMTNSSITNSSITNYELENDELNDGKIRNSSFVIPDYIRFKDDNGQDYPDWETKKLGEVISIFNGYAFSSKDSVNNGIVWVKITDVGIQQMKKDSLSFLPEVFAEKYTKFILKRGDYVIALTRPILNGELKIAKIDDFFDNSLLNQRVGKIISKNNTTYIYYVLQQEWLINAIKNNIAGTDPPNLSPKEINHIKLSIPEISEQTKIANFLTKIDSKITNCELQIINTKEYKKGLLQKMLA